MALLSSHVANHAAVPPIRARSAIEMIVFFMSLFPSQNSIRHLFVAAADMEMHLEASQARSARQMPDG